MSVAVGIRNGNVAILTGQHPNERIEELSLGQAMAMKNGLEQAILDVAARIETTGQGSGPAPTRTPAPISPSGFDYEVQTDTDGRVTLRIEAANLPVLLLPMEDSAEMRRMADALREAAAGFDKVRKRPN